MSSSTWRGNAIHYDESLYLWLYEDGQRVMDHVDRPCGHCGKGNTIEGHDGCLGTLPGVMNACCGHGEERMAYVQFEEGKLESGAVAVATLRRMKETADQEPTDE